MRACKECGAEIAANTSEIYDPKAVNPRHNEPDQPFYFELCPECARKHGHIMEPAILIFAEPKEGKEGVSKTIDNSMWITDDSQIPTASNVSLERSLLRGDVNEKGQIIKRLALMELLKRAESRNSN